MPTPNNRKPELPAALPDSDDKFELYLQQFRPLAPAPLESPKQAGTTSRRLFFAAGFAAIVAVVIAMVLVLHPRLRQTPAAAVRTEAITSVEPLTLRHANALLAAAPSFKEAVDHMAFQSEVIPLANDKRSALDVLSKDKFAKD